MATRMAMKIVAPLLRVWDKKTADRVHHFVAISEHVRQRIHRHYGREAEVIFPPVDTEKFQASRRDAAIISSECARPL